MNLTGDEIIEIIEEAGHQARPYSGRGMYGVKCIGVWFREDWTGTLGDIVERAAIQSDPEQSGWLVRNCKVDTPVLYWPSLEWRDEYAEDAEDESEG